MHDKVPPNDRHFYEVIQEGKQKLHFDVDIEEEKCRSFFSLNFAEDVKNYLIKEILNFLVAHQIPISINQDVLLFSSHGINRFSFHIIIDNYMMPYSSYCREASREIVGRTIEELRKKYPISNDQLNKIFDLSVNKQNQQFRIWGSSKYGKNRFKRLCREWNYFGQRIRWNARTFNDTRWNEERLKGFLEFERSLISYSAHDLPLINYVFPLTSPKNITHDRASLGGDVNFNLLSRLIPEGWKLGDCKNDGLYLLIKETPTICPLCRRVHEHDNQYLTIQGKRQDVYFRCFRTDADPLLPSEDKCHYVGSLETPPVLIEVIKPQDEAKVRSSEGMEYINQQYIGEINPADGILLNRSHLGTGKTTSYINYIRRNNLKRVLILSPRRLYARSITSEYNCEKPHLLSKVGEDFQCYLDDDVEINNCNRLVLQMESLHKLCFEKPFDVLILDEIEALLTQFSSGKTMKNVMNCSYVFSELVKTTPIIIGGDAFLDAKSIKTLKMLTGRRMKVIWNKFIPPQRKAIYLKKWPYLSFKFFQFLQEGKKIIFVCGSREKAISISKECEKQGFGYKLYTSRPDYPEENLRDLANVNEAWGNPNIRCVIFTSTITVGVNFDLKDIFDIMFIYGSARGCIVRDLFQGSFRVRHLKEDKIYFATYNRAKNKSLPTTHEGVETYLSQKCLNQEKTTHNYDNYLYKSTLQNEENGKIINEKVIQATWEYSPPWLRQCHIENILENNLSKTSFWQQFGNYLDLCNYRRFFPKINENEQFVGVNAKELTYRDLPDISSGYCTEIQVKKSCGIASEFEIKMLDKYYFRQRMNPKLSGDELAKFFDCYKKSTFYNLYFEKFKEKLIGPVLNYEIDHKYIEFAKDTIPKIQFIETFNKYLGIQKSCDPFVFDPNVSCLIAPWFFGNEPEIRRIFNIKDCNAQDQYTFIRHFIEKIYQSWLEAEFTTEQKRIQINFVRKKFTILKSDRGGGIELWNEMVYYDKNKNKSLEEEHREHVFDLMKLIN